MKLHSTYLFLLFCVLLYGCIDEDLSSGPKVTENNLQLKFVHTDGNGSDIFNDKIERVDVFVYDANEHFVKKHHVGNSSLSAFAGTNLTLPPGTYRLVCWGNAVEDNTQYKPTEGSLLKETLLLTGLPNKNEQEDDTDVVIATGHGVPLYYAPRSKDVPTSEVFTLTVPREGVKSTAINFGSAHIKVQVYVKGFEDFGANGQLLPPLIKLRDVPAGYNFELEPISDFIAHRDKAIDCTIDGQPMHTIDFYTPLFKEDTPAQIVIRKQSNGEVFARFSLADFIRDNNIDITHTSEPSILIFVEYNQVSVSISVPTWDYEDVEVEYGK